MGSQFENQPTAMKTVQVKVPSTLYKKARIALVEKDMNVSEFVRLSMKRLIEEQEERDA